MSGLVLLHPGRTLEPVSIKLGGEWTPVLFALPIVTGSQCSPAHHRSTPAPPVWVCLSFPSTAHAARWWCSQPVLPCPGERFFDCSTPDTPELPWQNLVQHRIV